MSDDPDEIIVPPVDIDPADFHHLAVLRLREAVATTALSHYDDCHCDVCQAIEDPVLMRALIGELLTLPHDDEPT